MKKNLKKLLCLALVVALTGSLFTACKKKTATTTQETVTLAPMTTEEITLVYSCWQDVEISEALAAEFHEEYPNITVEVKEFAVESNNAELIALAATGDLPDAFWVLNSPDVFITNGLLLDMSLLWEADPDSKNVIKGINEYKIGYLGTEGKWTTPVKFFPTAAFVNLDVFLRNGDAMPSTDWTWEEFEETVEKMSKKDKVDGQYIFGYNAGCTVITWYPIAADKDCIGEFGWNGSEYDMENWAYGMNLEAEWIQKEYKPYALGNGGEAQRARLYGGTPEAPNVLHPQDVGYVAIYTDNWWTWEDYWITENWIEKNKVIFVPYLMPHEEDAEGGNYIATMDMGGISPYSDWPREAYELLKYMTWGPQGWEKKIEHYPNLLEKSTGEDRAVSKNHCPITLDEGVWESFRAWHPNVDDPSSDEAVVSLWGEEYARAEYFEDFFDGVMDGTWVCYGGQQIPGFGTWLDKIYFGNDNEQNFGYSEKLGIENACIYGGVNAEDYYVYLQKEGNRVNKEKLQEIEDYLE